MAIILLQTTTDHVLALTVGIIIGAVLIAAVIGIYKLLIAIDKTLR